jgi:hypothetical protein
MFNHHARRAITARDSLSREVAERSVAQTLLQLTAIADNMSRAELRGYVRSHAAPFVRAEANQLVGYEWPRKDFNEFVAAALEHATHLVVEQWKHNSTVMPMPAPHVRLRIAA